MVGVNLTSAALDYVRRHGGHIMLMDGYRSGCCGGRIRVPALAAEQPKDASQYSSFEIDGCTVWVPSTWTSGRMEIDLARLWRFRKLVIQSIEIHQAGGISVA